MPSRVYDLFHQAMAGRKQIVCTYGGYGRELCPIILGHSGGEEKALTYQFGGQSKSGLPPGGEWRCLWLSKVSHVEPSTVDIVSANGRPAARSVRRARWMASTRSGVVHG